MKKLRLHKQRGLAMSAILAMFIGCSKDGASNSPTAYKDIGNTFGATETKAAESPPEKREPVQGVDVATLDSAVALRFEALVDKLPSPCGNAHSLRTSRNEDPNCKRAPFAVEYLLELLKDTPADGTEDGTVQELYSKRFREAEKHTFSYVESIPHHGPVDASVKIVEFYDYGCPVCATLGAIMDEALKNYETDAVLFYKQFPLSSHKDSPGAAQASLAAHQQGKFGEMHAMLFANQRAHKMSDLRSYAKSLGLEMKKWEQDYKTMKALVDADRLEGVATEIAGTPTIYINGRLYEGPRIPKYIAMWIDEALAQAI